MSHNNRFNLNEHFGFKKWLKTIMQQKCRIWPHYWNSHCRSYVCACARETHTMRGRHTEEKNKETEDRNEKETHDKTALRKEEIMLSTKPTGGNNTKIIQHNHQNQLTCAHTYGRAHPDCTDSYCRTWSEHTHMQPFLFISGSYGPALNN